MSTNHFIARLGKRTIAFYNEDCVDGMSRRVSPNSVDVIVTSPPYNLGITYSSYDDTISRAEYLAWMDGWASSAKRALSEQGSLFLNIGSVPSDPLVPFQVLDIVRKHLKLQNAIHWVKSIAIQKSDVGDYPGVDRDISVGHYKPINSERFLNDCHEYIFHFTHRGDVRLDRLAVGVPYQDKSNLRRWRSARDDLHCRGNCWFIPYETIKSRKGQRPHPATFPVKLAEMCIKLHGLERVRLVMDPFLGIGQSALAAMRVSADFVGFEIDPDYFSEACNRIRQRNSPNSARGKD